MSRRFCRINILFFAALFLLAADGGEPRSDKSGGGPITITSNRLEGDKLGEKATFSGMVTLKKENMTLTTDTMTVYYDEKTKEIREIEAHGNVVVRQEGRLAHAKNAWFYNADGKIVLTGDANVIENDNFVGGEKITIFLKDDRSMVEGGKVLLYQDRQGKKPEDRNRK
jgi:lipopolysaccharide export system protein LptA